MLANNGKNIDAIYKIVTRKFYKESIYDMQGHETLHILNKE